MITDDIDIPETHVYSFLLKNNNERSADRISVEMDRYPISNYLNLIGK